MELLKRRWRDLSLRKTLVVYITVAALLALVLCDITTWTVWKNTTSPTSGGNGWGREPTSAPMRSPCPPRISIPDKGDTARWEALSPVGVADCFSNPLIVVHVTSDILVPIDQTTREFTCHFNM